MALVFSCCLRLCTLPLPVWAMNSATDASVIYPPVCTKAAPDAPFGLRGDWGRFRRRRATPPSSISKTLMENHEKWMELCALASKEQDSAKLLALTQEIARLLEEKERRLKGQLPATDESSS